MTDTANPFNDPIPGVEDELTVTVTDPVFDLPDEGKFYPGTIERIEKVNGTYGPQFRWIIVHDEDRGKGADGQDRSQWHHTSTEITTSERNKLRLMVKWLTGKEPQKGEAVKLRPFFGQRAQFMYRHGKRADGVTPKADLIMVAPL